MIAGRVSQHCRAIATCAALCLAVIPSPAKAQDTSVFGAQFTVRDVRIEGIDRIEADTVTSYFGIRPGDVVNDLQLNNGLKALYSSNLFQDVSLRRDGETLIVIVAENPTIAKVVIEGNSSITKNNLQAELSIKERSLLTTERVRAETQRLTTLYRRSGYYSASVQPKIIQLPRNEVNLVFEIFEGEKSHIRSIAFIGNQAFSNDELMQAIQSTEYRWWKILTATDTFDAERIALDQDLLGNFYRSRGYANFEITSTTSELGPDNENFFVTFTLSEGKRYQFGEITITSSVADVRLPGLLERSDTTLKSGDWFNASAVDNLSGRIAKTLREDDRLVFIQVEDDLKRHDDGTIDVEFQIRQAPKVFVNQINIRGNTRTQDRVIRRELRIVEGDPVNVSLLQRSLQRIRNLGYFSQVIPSQHSTDVNDRVDFDITVMEQPTGEVSAGLGYSTFDGPQGTFSVGERNLLGRGQNLRLSYVGSGRSHQVNFSFTEPYFLARPIRAGVDVFNTLQNSTDESAYRLRSSGGSLRIGYDLSEYTSQNLRYTLRQNEVSGISSGASLSIQEQSGTTWTSLAGQTTMYDRRDNRFKPRSGYFVSLSNDYSGLGGDVHSLRSRLRGGYYRAPFVESTYWRQTVVRLVGDYGNIISFDTGGRIRIADRFYQPSLPMRGFNYSGIGPRDATTSDALGGSNYLTSTAQANFSLGLPESVGITGQLFFDVGSIWGRVDTRSTRFRASGEAFFLRAALGFGIAWDTPIGPVSVDYGIPIRKKVFDRIQRIRISFGTTF